MTVLRRPYLPFVMLAFFPVAMGAQDQGRIPLTSPGTACPVQLQSMKVHGNRLTIDYRNSTDRPMVGMTFGLAYYDAVHDPRRAVVLGGENRMLRPGKKRRTSFDIKYWSNSGYTSWGGWVQKILYPDNSTWEMNDSYTACSIRIGMIKYSMAPTLPSSVVTSKAPAPVLTLRP